jgi:methylmalonyl-CoA mutase cobalamin-binding subunit
MLIYPEGGTLHADYLDGGHVIHYTGATIKPGEAVAFHTAESATVPVFSLVYSRTGANTMSVISAVRQPHVDATMVIAKGALKRD